MGSGGGSVGRAVAPDSRGPRLESSHRKKIILNIYSLYWKDENKEKEAGNGPFLKKTKMDPMSYFYSIAKLKQNNFETLKRIDMTWIIQSELQHGVVTLL